MDKNLQTNIDCFVAGTNSRHDQNLTQTVILFQFCEAISKYSIKEPGPLISLLLDYVGHIKLCSRLLEILDGCNDRKHIKSKAGTRDHHSSLFITHYDYSYLPSCQSGDCLKFLSLRSGWGLGSSIP